MAKLEAADEFAKCRSIFETTVLSAAYRGWYDESCRDYDYYEGRSFSADDLEKLHDACIRPFQHNLIGPRINSVAGKAIQARTTINYKSRTGSDDEVKTAEGLSALAMFVQDKNKSMRIIGEAGVSAIICGLGWHAFDVDDGVIREIRESVFDVVWDVRDRTQYLTNQGFVASMIWKSREEWKLIFEGKEAEIDGLAANGSQLIGGGSDYSLQGERLRLISNGAYYDKGFDELCVVKFEYRIAAKYYVYTSKDNGAVYQTFDKKEAENTGVGTKPVSGYAKGTVTAAAVSAGALTIDAPPASVPIAAWTANVRDTSGRPLFPAIVFVSPTFYVSSSNGTSGTLVSGSLVTIDISYDRNQ